MARYILKRVLIGIISILALTTLTFFMIHAVPGGPFQVEGNVSQAAVDNMIRKYGVDKPVIVQYGMYMKNFFRGDLGESLKYNGVSVNELIGRGLGRTAALALWSLLLSVGAGVLLGIFASLKPRGIADNICTAVSTIGICIPNYVLCIALMYIFGIVLGVLPITGLNSWKNYILPVISLSLNPIANIAKLTRSGMIEALNQDYIITAKAKGLSSFRVIMIHAMRNALLPVFTYLGPLVAYLLTGSFVTEDMFSIAGVGRIFVQSINNRDYTSLTGMVTFFGVIIIVVGILVDILYALTDPRVKLES